MFYPYYQSATEPPHLLYLHLTLAELTLKFHPLLQNHLKLLENEVVPQPIPARVGLDEIDLVGCSLFDGSVDGDACPCWDMGYQ